MIARSTQEEQSESSAILRSQALQCFVVYFIGKNLLNELPQCHAMTRVG